MKISFFVLRPDSSEGPYRVYLDEMKLRWESCGVSQVFEIKVDEENKLYFYVGIGDEWRKWEDGTKAYVRYLEDIAEGILLGEDNVSS